MSEAPRTCYRFDSFTVEPHTGRLRRGSTVVPVEPRVFSILLFLLENRSRLVGKGEIFEEVWEGTLVTDSALTRALARLRKALDDDPREPRYVETVHGRGYRFLADVEVLEADAAAPDVRPPPLPGPTAQPRWVIAAAAVLAGVVLAGAAVHLWQRRAAAAPEAAVAEAAAEPLDPRRVAALPMVDLSGGNDAYLVDGLTEQMISTLSRIDGLTVVPRTTVMAYKGSGKRISEIGRELGAGTVLEGSVRREGDQLRITVQLVDAVREEALWSVEFDRPLRDVFEVQSEVAVRVATALKSSIEAEDVERIRLGPTREITAFDHYLKGRAFALQQTRIGNENALEHYRRALELDPDFALALAGLANSYVFRAMVYDDSDVAWSAVATASAEHALEIDPSLPQAYKALGAIAFYHDRYERAFELTLKALEFEPHHSGALYNATSFALELGRLDQAVLLHLRTGGSGALHRAPLAMTLWELGFVPQAEALARRALEEEPLNVYLNLYLVRRGLLEGEVAAARERLARLRQAHPDRAALWELAGRVEERAGRRDEALAYYEKAQEIMDGDFPEAAIRAARIRWLEGEPDRARQVLERIARRSRRAIDEGSDRWLDRWRLAAVAAVRGDAGEAVDWLGKAVDLGHCRHHFDAADPVFESLRTDPGFERQLERMRSNVAAMRERLVRELGPDLAAARLP